MPRKATVRARGLGAELKELRLHAGLTTRKVGELAGWSHATVSRMEVGTRGVTPEEVATLLAIYQVTGETRDRLLDLAREVDRPGWWETGDTAIPQQLTALIGFEAQAARIIDVALLLVPGLLQTADYTRAIMAAADIPKATAETRIATRLGRQAILSEPNAPRLLAFIDEGVLHRPLGGSRTMRDQLHHLVNTAQQPRVEVRVLPFTETGHRALNGSFTMLEFTKARAIVLLEHKRSSLFLDDPKDSEAFAEDIAVLQETALNHDDSVEFISDFAQRYERP